MKLTIHRGTHEIGGSCVELESGPTRVIVDVGFPLVNEDREPFDQNSLRGRSKEELLESGVLPGVPGLFADGSPVDAILLSHSHLDHVGLLHLTPPEVPVYASSGTSKMMNAGAIFSRQNALPRERHSILTSGQPVTIGGIKVTPFSVDHSCFGSMAFLVEAEGKRVFYSGDLRFHGRKPGMIKSLIADIAPLNIDALVMEGTHFGGTGRTKKTEYDLEFELAELVRSAPGLVLGAFSPIDVDRLVSYLRAAIRSDRVLVVDAYAAYVMHLVASEIGIPHPKEAKGLRVYSNQAFQRRGIKKLQDLFSSKRIELSEVLSSSGEFLMVFRPSMVDLDFDGCLPDQTRCIYSYWRGYLERDDWVRLQAHLTEVGGDFIPAHTSGHIFVEDLVTFVNSINPKTVIPIHTFEPTEFKTHFPNVALLQDGEPLAIQ